MIEVVVSRLGLDSATQSYVVILQEKDGDRLLPIWIGRAEAESIVVHIHNIKRDRPNTHDLCRSLITGMGGALQRIQITRLEDNTYYAELHIGRGTDVIRVDARPSDSIAIALRLGAPIFAEEDLLSEVQIEESEDEEASGDEGPGLGFDPSQARSESELNAEQLKEYLERLRPEDFGKFNL